MGRKSESDCRLRQTAGLRARECGMRAERHRGDQSNSATPARYGFDCPPSVGTAQTLMSLALGPVANPECHERAVG